MHLISDDVFNNQCASKALEYPVTKGCDNDVISGCYWEEQALDDE